MIRITPYSLFVSNKRRTPLWGILLMSWEYLSPLLGDGMGVDSLLMHQRADLLAFHHATQVANDVHVEDIDGKVVVLTHANG